MLKDPPDILITTPESLFIMLTSDSYRKLFRTVEYIIVDEIHSICSGKRGVHLSISIERVERIAGKPPKRIGLTATINPLEEAAKFLAGGRSVAVINCDRKGSLIFIEPARKGSEGTSRKYHMAFHLRRTTGACQGPQIDTDFCQQQERSGDGRGRHKQPGGRALRQNTSRKCVERSGMNLKGSSRKARSRVCGYVFTGARHRYRQYRPCGTGQCSRYRVPGTPKDRSFGAQAGRSQQGSNDTQNER